MGKMECAEYSHRDGVEQPPEWQDLVEPVFLRQLVLDNLYKPDCQKSDASEIRPEHSRRDSETSKLSSKFSVPNKKDTAVSICILGSPSPTLQAQFCAGRADSARVQH
jgi:hypothetical protein